MDKELSEFYKDKSRKDGFHFYCKKCAIIRAELYRENNKEKCSTTSQEYYQKNKEKVLTRQKQYQQLNKKRISSYMVEYNQIRQKNDIQYNLVVHLRNRLTKAIKYNSKSGSAVKDLGCSIDELKSYLESKFQPGMTWENWGLHGWHIDHIKPLAKFNLTQRDEMLEAVNYKNLQPLWAIDNWKKGSIYED